MDDSDTYADALDIPGRLRYGVPTARKEALASARALPGAPEDNTADQDVANRYAAGFMFAQQHPHLAPLLQPIVNAIKTSDLPLVGGASPELQSYAQSGMNRALLERQRPSSPVSPAIQAAALRTR